MLYLNAYLTAHTCLVCRIVREICYEIDLSIQQGRVLSEIKMSGLAPLSDKLEKFLKLLVMHLLFEEIV